MREGGREGVAEVGSKSKRGESERERETDRVESYPSLNIRSLNAKNLPETPNSWPPRQLSKPEGKPHAEIATRVAALATAPRHV